MGSHNTVPVTTAAGDDGELSDVVCHLHHPLPARLHHPRRHLLRQPGGLRRSGLQLDDSHRQQNQPQGSAKGHLKGGVLPAYCDPPNPCPKGYTAEDGCIEVEEFDNEAEFSRNYQAAQSCMCDSEHMFSCPEDNSFSQVYSQPQDGGLSLFGLSELDSINNPFLSGSKLPIAAKKGLGY